jgi:hydroxymethylbilane synthase
VRIATRGSALALAQARQVADALGGAELVTIRTSGDGDGPPSGGQEDKARWVRELERALLAEEVDLAVHSAKDVPIEMPDGLVLIGSPARADARDCLCGAPSLDSLRAGARVGTSSLRRTAQLRALRDDIEVVGLRGNVDTRLRHLRDGEYDAILIATAGLDRLGRGAEAGAVLEPDVFVPAAGQGTLALQARSGDAAVLERARAIADPVTEACLAAERALVRALQADCDTPMGAHAVSVDGGLLLSAFVGRADGTAWIRDQLEGQDPDALGAAAAERLRAAGAEEILGRSAEPGRLLGPVARANR